MSFVDELLAEVGKHNHLSSNWNVQAELIRNDPSLLPQETKKMNAFTGARITRRDVVFNKMMSKGLNPATDAQLKTERFDDEESFATFVAEHEFITNIINWGHGSYEVEYLA